MNCNQNERIKKSAGLGISGRSNHNPFHKVVIP